MASPQPQPSGSQPATQEYTVRVPRNTKNHYSVLKFNPANKVDFTKCGGAKLERENNYKEFKLSYDIDVVPKFGAGSEFGREQREEARRKKYGVQRKKYNPEDQPWLLKLGSGKQTRKFKGSKEGGVTDNASYYIFTQCPDGAFEAHPVEEWFNFAPVIKYRYLNSEEAEEEFSRRDRTLNYFSIMLKKRITNKDDDEPEEGEKKTGKKSKKKDFLLTDLDDWALMDEGEDSDGSLPDAAEEDSKKPKKKPTGKNKKKKRRNSDSEAEEESDDLDEGKEVDYMTDTDSEDDDMYADPSNKQSDKYAEKGVEDEEGLRKAINSDDEDEEEEKKEEEEEPEEKEGTEAKPKKEESDSDSSGASDSDSDVEKEPNVSSALFMQGDSKKKGGRRVSLSSEGTTGSATNSRSATPTVGSDEAKAKKRRHGDATDSPSAKRPRPDTPTKRPRPDTPTNTPASISPGSSDGITEDAVRRYLMRKPMTTLQLLQKFKSKYTGLSKEQLVNTLTQILKRLNPEKQQIKDKMFLSIKKTE